MTRPRTYDATTPTTTISVTVPVELRDHLAELGGYLGMSAAQYIRSLLHQHSTKQKATT